MIKDCERNKDWQKWPKMNFSEDLLISNQFHKPKKMRSTFGHADWREIGDKRIYFRSIWEANFARYLQFLKDHKQIKEWQHEPHTFWFEEIKRGVRSYLPDFLVIENDDRGYWVEVKGFMDPKSLTKIKRFRKYYPEHELRVIDKKWFTENGKKLHGLIPGWEKANQFRRPSHEKLESMFRLQV